MHVLDIKTIMFGFFVSNVLLTIVMAYVWVQNRKRYNGISYWLIDYVFQTIGIFLMTLRGSITDILSTSAANILIVCGMLFFLLGLQKFLDRKTTPAVNLVILVVFFFLHYFFGIVGQSYPARVVLLSIPLMIIIAQALYILLQTEKGKRNVYGTPAIVCVCLLLLYSFRIFAIFYTIPADNDFIDMETIDSIIRMSSQMLSIMMIISLILMINMRLFHEVQQLVEEKELIVQEFRRIANTDGLTGLYNRSKIEQILTVEVLRARRYKHPLSIILADVDHFKQVNDTYGHNVGDVVLTGIASLMKEYIREVDSLGRWGGEEFLIVCPETSVHGARKLAEKLRKKIEKHHFKDLGMKTVSMGVAQLEHDEWDEDMLKRADKNLYKAKRGGRNRVE